MNPRAAVVLMITLFVAAVAAPQQPAPNSSSPVPQLIPYSGVASDVNGKALSGTVGITFLLYQHEQGGSPLWLETQNVQADARGQYSVQLGVTRPNGMPNDLFVSGEARWLAVQIAGQAETGRVMLLSVPYALKAGDAATVGGLPPSAFAPQNSASSGTSSASSNSNGNSPPLGGSGSTNYLAIWTDNNGDLGDSAIFQAGTASKPKIGIGTTKPAATLDVKGGSTIRGLFSLPAAGTATAAAGFNSQPIDLVSSAFNSGTNTAVNQTFQWQAEPVGNNTANTTGSLNLLFAQGTSKPSQTGLNIASNGQITFATGQTFPGTGTVTSVGSGLGLTGGPIKASGTLAIDTTVVPQLNIANNFTANQTVNGSVSATQLVSTVAQGTAPMQVTSTTQVPNLNASFLDGLSASAFQVAGSYATLGANSFSATQTISNGDLVVGNGNISLPENSCCGGQGVILIGGSSFIHTCCTVNAGNTYVGVQAGSLSNTAAGNTAEGYFSLASLTQGQSNTASGFNALGQDDAGSNNTGIGVNALFSNNAGANNTALGFKAGANGNFINIAGSNNTFLGYESAPGATQLTNATAIGANALVSENNALVLGSIAGLNGATANTNVGIGTNTPAYTLDVQGTGNFTGVIKFASGQTFPGTGTVTSVGSGAGLTGGPITGSGSLSIASGGVTNAMLANSSVAINSGTDLLGGGPVSLGGATSLSLDTTKVPQLNTANTFTGNQTVNGNLSATGVVTGSGFQIGSNLFASGSYASGDSFLGFAGNGTVSGVFDTATGAFALASNAGGNNNSAHGVYALLGNTTGSDNTASGTAALYSNTTGNGNTAMGKSALPTNSTGGGNTGVGDTAGYTADSTYITGFANTFLGANAFASTGTLSNATAIGANSEVAASNALVLGSINGVNGTTASTNVGIGTTAPSYLLHIGNMGGATYNNFLRVEGPTAAGTGGWAASFGGNGSFGIDSVNSVGGRFVVTEIGRVGIGAATPIVTHSLTIGQNTGHAIADGWDTYSSRRWKTNIQTLHGALAKVEHLRGVSYDLKESGKHEVGVIAEEVGAVVPEIVSWEDNGKDARGVDYSRLTALLIEATKEQQAVIDKQQQRINQQQEQIASQRAQISRLRDRDAQQAHGLQTVAAQVTLLQSKLAQLEGSVSDLRQAMRAASEGPNSRQVAVAIAQSVWP